MESIGLDVHRHYTVYARVDETGRVLARDKVAHEALPTIIRQAHAPCRATLEATGNWGYIADLLQPGGEELVLAHPLQVRAIAAAKVKTDKIDATILAQLLRGDLIPRAYLAPPEVRELRDLLRLRASLVRLRTAGKNKVHAILAKRGLRVPVTDLFGRAGRRWLAGPAASPGPPSAIQSYLAVIEPLDAEIDRVSREVARQAEERQETPRLTSIPRAGRHTAP